MSSVYYVIVDKIAADSFKDEITPWLKANDRLKFSQDVALNNAREKGKPQREISYKVLKEEYGYDPLLDMSTYITLIQLKYYLGGINHCVTGFGKWIFDSNFLFALPLTKNNLDYCFINDN